MTPSPESDFLSQPPMIQQWRNQGCLILWKKPLGRSGDKLITTNSVPTLDNPFPASSTVHKEARGSWDIGHGSLRTLSLKQRHFNSSQPSSMINQSRVACREDQKGNPGSHQVKQWQDITQGMRVELCPNGLQPWTGQLINFIDLKEPAFGVTDFLYFLFSTSLISTLIISIFLLFTFFSSHLLGF